MRDNQHLQAGAWRARYFPVRPSWLSDQQRIRRRGPWHRCTDCGGARPLGPMLIEDLWERLGGDDDVLCHPCLCRRLGRPVTVRDLRECLFNLEHLPERLLEPYLREVLRRIHGRMNVQMALEARVDEQLLPAAWRGDGELV